MAKIQIIGVGALNTDHIYKVERILEDGETVQRGVEKNLWIITNIRYSSTT